MELVYAALRLLAEAIKALGAFVEYRDSARRREDHTSTRRPRHLRE
jgi:hypothetical protein